MTVADVGTSPEGMWLDTARQRLADVTGESLSEYEVSHASEERLLRLASVAAHKSGERKNAPLIAYLVGLAKGRHPEHSLDELVTSCCGPEGE